MARDHAGVARRLLTRVSASFVVPTLSQTIFELRLLVINGCCRHRHIELVVGQRSDFDTEEIGLPITSAIEL